MTNIIYEPIGIIHTPFKQAEGMPIQPSAARGIKGQIIIDEQYVDGLSDLDGFSHIYLLFHLHLSKSFTLKVVPFLDDQNRGVFATRAPKRPNPIGLSVVKLIQIKNNIIEIENIDMIDGTPLLDIKPFVKEMEAVEEYRTGWLSQHNKEIDTKKADNRFE
ncbi:MAG: tRNA (N6-threonylcarbamoyladenosine(37)-N6)-methyltransferase TrmO [Calditrichaceae bacterium]|jgi:tRNA-Thr(GGU) m(6)t(6)A37 methyltransferase TsaA